MVKNSDVIRDFETGGTKVKSKHLYIEKADNGDTALYNYNTPLAYLDKNTGITYVGDVKYSKTTSAIQNKISGKRLSRDEFRALLNKKQDFNTGWL